MCLPQSNHSTHIVLTTGARFPTHIIRIVLIGVGRRKVGDVAGSEGLQVVAPQGDVQQVGVERLAWKH